MHHIQSSIFYTLVTKLKTCSCVMNVLFWYDFVYDMLARKRRAVLFIWEVYLSDFSIYYFSRLNHEIMLLGFTSVQIALEWNEIPAKDKPGQRQQKNGIFHTLLHPPSPTVAIHALRTCNKILLNKILLEINCPSKFPTKKKSGSLTVIGKKTQQSAFKKTIGI